MRKSRSEHKSDEIQNGHHIVDTFNAPKGYEETGKCGGHETYQIHSGNIEGDPAFVFPYFNGGKGLTVLPGETTTSFLVPVAFDEGGNFIQVRFGPLTQCDDAAPGDGDPGTCSDYHISAGSPAQDAGVDLTASFPSLSQDFDREARPAGAGVDIGADEIN